MSTSAIQKSAVEADFSPAWKQEVNRRLADHRNRKGFSAAEPQPRAEGQPNASRRAAEAAARVAARYAKAPSYSEVLANEARAAIRAAEAASEAALKAKAAAQSVLAGIESAAAIDRLTPPMGLMANASMELAVMPAPASMMASEMDPAIEHDFAQMELHRSEISERVAYEEPAAPASQPVSVRWDRDLPMRSAENAQQIRSSVGQSTLGQGTLGQGALGQAPTESAPGDWWSGMSVAAEEPEEIETVEPAQPILANLIEFPRELVATRRARPRLAESLHAAPETGVQLSIFEVDPAAIEPAMSAAPAAPSVWETQWSGIELDAQPLPEAETSFEDPAPATDAGPAGERAPMNLRLMALAVDAALIGGAFLSAATLAARNARMLPGLHALEIGATVALLLTAAVYQALFFSLARATPGMKYARIRLSTLDGLTPTRAHRCTRLAALLLSVLPLGLGVVWSLFDEDHLSWHDRLSGTYLCKC